MTCSVEGCSRARHKADLCRGHYERRREGRTVDGPLREWGRPLRQMLKDAAIEYANADSEDDAKEQRAFETLRKYMHRWEKRRRRMKQSASAQSVPEDRTSGRG